MKFHSNLQDFMENFALFLVHPGPVVSQFLNEHVQTQILYFYLLLPNTAEIFALFSKGLDENPPKESNVLVIISIYSRKVHRFG
jgi:hypothetical protein